MKYQPQIFTMESQKKTDSNDKQQNLCIENMPVMNGSVPLSLFSNALITPLSLPVREGRQVL